MDRTRKLLMGVTASALLVTGQAKTDAGLAQATAWTVDSANVDSNGIEAACRYYYQKKGGGMTADADESRRVASAAAVITELLNGRNEQSALAIFEMIQMKPELNRPVAEKAIAGLMNSGQIRRTGEGSKFKPYRYYDKVRSGSGG